MDFYEERGGDITGRTLGIIGAGRIGSAMAAKSIGFNMRVLYYDVVQNQDLEAKVGARKVGIEELLRQSDFISVHLDLNDKTRHFIGEPQLRLMKKTAYLINTSRGPIIDETALVRALKENWIAGAGLDVYEDEPAIRQWMAQRWPTVKKNARRQRAWMIFQDESGISERPSIRRTWVPREEKPVLVHAYNWKKLSLCGAIAYRWDGRRARLLFQTTSGSYDGKKLIGFLKELRQEFRDRRVILIWDGLPARRSRQVQACLWGNGSGCTRSGCRATRPN